jgi:hypothetical protein
MNKIAKASLALAVIFIIILLPIFVQTGWRYGVDRCTYQATTHTRSTSQAKSGTVQFSSDKWIILFQKLFNL